MQNLTKPLAVLFDWDGTLVDSSSAILAANNHVRRTFGLSDFTLEDVVQVTRMGTAREVFKILYPDRAQEALDVYYGAVPQIRGQHLTVIDQAHAFVKNLAQRDIPLGVVSNMAHGPLIDEITGLGWAGYFKAIVGAGEAPRGKPAPDPVYLAADRMGLSRGDLAQVWFVGDMETDEKAAKAAGCPFLYYTGGISDAAERGSMQAVLKFSNYDQLWRDISPLLT